VPTIQQTLRSAIAQLDAAGVDAPATTARLLLAEILGVSKEWLVVHAASPLDPSVEQRFQHMLARVVAREPLAYVLGRRAFYGLDVIVDRRVLIPRPETEMLVDLALAALRMDGRVGQGWSVVDVGTGSGAVAVAVAKHAPAIRVLATDISAEALAVARLNAQRHGVAERLAFVQADLLAGIGALPPVVVANLPYVARAEIDILPPEIQSHEPRVALDGGEDGLALVRRLLAQIADRWARGRAPRAAYLEIGASQGQAALAAAQALLPAARCAILKDLAGLDRVLAIQFNP
jgi:release factor glutamine methyltransferase